MDLSECWSSTWASRKWRSYGCPMRIDDAPIASFARRTASAQASAAKQTAPCSRIFDSTDSSAPVLTSGSLAAVIAIRDSPRSAGDHQDRLEGTRCFWRWETGSFSPCHQYRVAPHSTVDER